MKPLEMKTISDWVQEVKLQAHRFTQKYEQCFVKRSSMEEMQFYRATKDKYYGLFNVLRHLDTYHNLVDKEKCLSCKFEAGHIEKLERDFKRWKPFIAKCRDGFRYV